MRNRYPGTCRSCGAKVAARAGGLVRDGRRWLTYCAEHTPAPAPPPRGEHPGWHGGELAGFDCETSARDPRTAFLVSAALVDTSGATRTWLVHPGEREIPEEAIAVHGITNERARDEGVPAPQALSEIADILTDHLRAGRGLAIFNAPYDLRVLDGELRRCGIQPLESRLTRAPSPIVDPLVIDRGIDPYRSGPRNLGAMCDHYGVGLVDAHTADGDAAACLSLAREIGARYPDLAGLELAELHERQVAWAADRARDRQTWLDNNRPGHGTVVDGTWPY
ncbi:DNA polymerase-3 subunit epsilon [Haloactinospora alba]|uniref:DNA polymerase-3 subunit epsilon n=1 Tax=Haloactinospora alba TaxID=405555 RepID=A0A543NMY0_9ACTN|nr:exonuclease domain-containing protein [Haloactinospora alba]TQN33182.1 DNA polymerase-3 subunit epsilon [Haloactinospora alba]